MRRAAAPFCLAILLAACGTQAPQAPEAPGLTVPPVPAAPAAAPASSSLAAASAQALRGRADFRECTPPRPEICTYQYQPVCALVRTQEGTLATMTRPSPCAACADAAVIGAAPGACDAEEAPANEPQLLDTRAAGT